MKYLLYDEKLLIVVRHITRVEIVDDTTIELWLGNNRQRLHLPNKESMQRVFNEIVNEIKNEEDYGKKEIERDDTD
jgi:hypothetical protein